MKTLTVGQFKSDFSAVLDLIRKGESVSLSYGKKKQQLAVLVPYDEYKKTKPIKLGLYKDKVSFKIHQDFKMTNEEFLGS